MPDKPATRDYHPARVERLAEPPRRPRKVSAKRLVLPKDEINVEVKLEGRTVKLTNLAKPFWPKLGITKRGLIQYYADVAPYLLPHLTDRAMVMKRYPNGAAGDFFFMKREKKERCFFACGSKTVRTKVSRLTKKYITSLNIQIIGNCFLQKRNYMQRF